MSLINSGLGYQSTSNKTCGNITNCNSDIYGKCSTPFGPSFQALQKPGNIVLLSSFSPAVKSSMSSVMPPHRSLYSNKSTLPNAKGEQVGVL
jgi:hypothetical protein